MVYDVRPQTGYDPPDTGHLFYQEQVSVLISDVVREKLIPVDSNAIKNKCFSLKKYKYKIIRI